MEADEVVVIEGDMEADEVVVVETVGDMVEEDVEVEVEVSPVPLSQFSLL